MTTWGTPRKHARKAGQTDKPSRPGDHSAPPVATRSPHPIPGLIAGGSGPLLPHPVRPFVLRRKRLEDLKTSGEAVRKLAETAPRSGANMWVARDKASGATVHVIGTHHGLNLCQVAAWEKVVNHLTTTPFTHIYTETTPASTVSIPGGDALLGDLQFAAQARAALDPLNKELAPHETSYQNAKGKLIDLRNERERLASDPEALQRIEEIDLEIKRLDVEVDRFEPVVSKLQKAQRVVGFKYRTVPEYAGNVQRLQLDDAYLALARSRHPDAVVGLLDEPDGRTIATLVNESQGVRTRKDTAVASVVEQELKDVAAGDQRAIFTDTAREQLEGLDNANTEERNRQWMHALIREDTSERQMDEVKMRQEKQKPDNTKRQRIKKGDVQLWIVGAGHLPGLILKLRGQGWDVDHRDPT